MPERADLDALAVTFADHADRCLIEAQAAVIDGQTDRARELAAIAETWVALIRAFNGDADEGD